MAADAGPRARRPRWWQWPTILSLDAPLVALLWQRELAAAAGVAVRPVEAFVLASSIWLSYAGDRWVEGWRLLPSQIRTHRHQFYQDRWGWVFVVGWLVLAGDVIAAFRGLSRREIAAGLVLFGAVLAYLFSHQFLHVRSPGRAPKELCIAALLGAGVALFPAVAPGADRWALAPALALFALLCLANCALISVWESGVDQSHGQTSLARQFRSGRAFSRALPWAVAAAAAALWPWCPAGARAAAACAFASGVLLAALDRLEPRLGREPARVLADVALLTPAVPLALAALRP